MILRDLLDLNFNSTHMRKLLGLYYRENRTYRIPFGQLRGKKMQYDSAMNFHTMLGLSDLDVFRTLRKLFSVFPLPNGASAVDLGANRGVYTLWLATIGHFSKVYSFEPNPSLVGKLRKNIAINDLLNVEAHALACADKIGKMSLFLGENDSTSSIVQNGGGQAIEIVTTSLDEFFLGNSSHQRPSFIKMDIEGAGVLALPGAARCISEVRPLLYLESHSPDEDREIGNLLTTLDYQALRVREREWVELVDEVYPNLRGVWGNMIACPTEHQIRIASAMRLRPRLWQKARRAA